MKVHDCSPSNVLIHELSQEEYQFAEFILSRHKEGYCRCAGNGHCIAADYLSLNIEPESFINYVRKAYRKIESSDVIKCPVCNRTIYNYHKNGFKHSIICPCGEWIMAGTKEE